MGLTELESRCQLSWFLLEVPGLNPLPCLFQLLEQPTALSCGLFLLYPQIQELPIFPSSSLYLSLPPRLI